MRAPINGHGGRLSRRPTLCMGHVLSSQGKSSCARWGMASSMSRATWLRNMSLHPRETQSTWHTVESVASLRAEGTLCHARHFAMPMYRPSEKLTIHRGRRDHFVVRTYVMMAPWPQVSILARRYGSDGQHERAIAETAVGVQVNSFITLGPSTWAVMPILMRDSESQCGVDGGLLEGRDGMEMDGWRDRGRPLESHEPQRPHPLV